MKKISLIIFLLGISSIVYSCKNNSKTEPFSKKDTINSNEIEMYLDTIKKTNLTDKKIFLDFYFGEPLNSVILKRKRYINEKRIIKKNVGFDNLPHFFYFITLDKFNITTKEKTQIKIDIRFNFEKDKLSSILLSMYAPSNFVPNELKKTLKISNLKELEDNLTGKSNSINFEEEMKNEEKNIKIISSLYTSDIYNEINELYSSKYGNPIYIRDELKLKNPFNNNDNEPTDLLWLVNGKYIKFRYVGNYNISSNYYNFNEEDVLIGSIFYNTIKAEIKNIKMPMNLNSEQKTNQQRSESNSILRKKSEETGI